MNKIKLFFSNLDNYVWQDSEDNFIIIENTSWFWGLYFYPLVIYYYYNDLNIGHPILSVLPRWDFIKYMKATKNER